MFATTKIWRILEMAFFAIWKKPKPVQPEISEAVRFVLEMERLRQAPLAAVPVGATEFTDSAGAVIPITQDVLDGVNEAVTKIDTLLAAIPAP